MLRIHSSLFFSFVFFLINQANAECFLTRMKYIQSKKEKFRSFQACKLDNFIVSKSCSKRKTCKLVQKLREVGDQKKSPFGSPHFSACHRASGRPIIGELYFRGKWYKKSLCFDGEFKSFVEGAYILKMYQKPSKK